MFLHPSTAATLYEQRSAQLQRQAREGAALRARRAARRAVRLHRRASRLARRADALLARSVTAEPAAG